MTIKQIELLKKVIDENLIIRGINVETTLEFNENGRPKLNSTNFQTFPVIHYNLHIENFGGYTSEDEKRNDVQNICIPVNVRYDGNGVDLFVVTASIMKEVNNLIFEVNVEHKTN